jgi:CO dehydrogenase maturation factor
MTTIAVAGKGGVGKTTISAFTVQWLIAHGRSPVLAVDADSNSNFHELLGAHFTETVGSVREEARKQVSSLAGGIAKQQFLEMRIAQSLVEQNGYDLLVMGRPEGPGCYCFANNVLRDAIAKLAVNYRSVVVDCEAGLEHVSRRTVFDIDYLFTVSDPSLRSLRTATRIGGLIEEMKTRVRHPLLIVNQMRNVLAGLTEQQKSAIIGGEFERIMLLPFDDAVCNMDEQGGAMCGFPVDAPLSVAVNEMLSEVLKN